MPSSATVQASRASTSRGGLLTARPSTATPKPMMIACWTSSAAITGTALPASTSAGRAAVARTRSQVRQIRSVRIELPAMESASSENVTRVAMTACAVPAAGPWAVW